MELKIRKLAPEFADDYFDFFDCRAFTDNAPYRCYCQMYQMSKAQRKEATENFQGDDIAQLWKSIAKSQIETGLLRGYLAYIDGKAVGWCNANDRANFPDDPCCDVLFHSPVPNCEIAVACFEIAPDYRRRGIATALLTRVIADAIANHYSSVVGFPVLRTERYEWDCTGPVHMFEKAGFAKVSVHDNTMIMKKDLRHKQAGITNRQI